MRAIVKDIERGTRVITKEHTNSFVMTKKIGEELTFTLKPGQPGWYLGEDGYSYHKSWLKIKGGKMKEQKKVYPKVKCYQWKCATNEDTELIETLAPPFQQNNCEVAVYELKEVIRITMKPHQTKVK